jgi:hypothetical protein
MTTTKQTVLYKNLLSNMYHPLNYWLANGYKIADIDDTLQKSTHTLLSTYDDFNIHDDVAKYMAMMSKAKRLNYLELCLNDLYNSWLWADGCLKGIRLDPVIHQILDRVQAGKWECSLKDFKLLSTLKAKADNLICKYTTNYQRPRPDYYAALQVAELINAAWAVHINDFDDLVFSATAAIRAKATHSINLGHQDYADQIMISLAKIVNNTMRSDIE